MSSIMHVQIFECPEFGEIRTAGTSEEPLFCLADLCRALNLTPNKVVQRLEKGVLSKYPLQTAGGEQVMNFVNEDGLYDAILDSRKPEAKNFRKWITNEVLPSIRKTGGYIAANDDDSADELMAKALLVAQNTLARREERLKQLQEDNERKQHLIEQKNDEIKEMKPHADYAKLILSSTSTVKVTQIAQDYGMSAKKFNAILCELDIQYKVGTQWILKSKYKDKGYVHSKSFNIPMDGKPDKVMMNTEWTQKGRLFLYETLKKHSIVPMIEQTLLIKPAI